MVTEAQRYVVAPQDGERLINPVGGQIVQKISERRSNGAYTLFENSLPAHNAGPLPHIHYRHDELFYVLEGSLTAYVAEQTITAPAGSCVLVSRGLVHRPANPSDQPVRFLLIFSPGGMDNFFADASAWQVPLQQPASDPAALAALQQFSQKYHFALAALPEVNEGAGS